MIVIDNVILSDNIKDKFFHCDLNACKGGCCVQGDSGAGLAQDELAELEKVFPIAKKYIDPRGIQAIEKKGFYEIDPEDGKPKTTLRDDEVCAYGYEENGITLCGIEKAWRAGESPFMKPVSCHLYPIRITEYEGFQAVNYEEWDICDPACVLGAKMALPVYKFLKEPLIRKFGSNFYETLEATIQHLENQEE